MKRFVNRDEMWTNQERLDIRSDNYWGKLRVLRDKTDKFFYYDILVGKKGETDYRVHLGYDLIGNVLFTEPRGRVAEIKRDITSQQHGELPSEKMIFKEATPKTARIHIEFIPKGKEKESKVTDFEIIES